MGYDKFIFHVDMDSFFASCEQQANFLLSERPIVVSGKEGSRSVIVASSVEAKKLGIKTGMLPHEAKKIYPKIVFVEPDGAKYEWISRRLMSIFQKFSDKVQIFSIDEAFLDMTGFVRNAAEAMQKAFYIKQAVKNELGEKVTCSIGISYNKLLAKLASDKNKPNGLFFIDQKSVFAILNDTKLTDVCGIGRGLEKRLKLLGIGNFQQLRDKPKNFLQKFFGNIGGENLFNMSRGIDESEVVPEDEKGDCKSVSRSYTLAQNTFDKNEILAVLMRLCLDASCALRRDNLAGRTIVFFFRYADFTGAGFRRTFKIGVDDGVQIYEVAEKIVRPWKLHKAVRLVGVHISNLVIDAHQTSLFDDVVKKVKMQKAIDEINDRYGNHTVKPAFLLKLKRLRNKVGGFKI